MCLRGQRCGTPAVGEPDLKHLRLTCHLNLLQANAALHRLAQAEGLTYIETQLLELTEKYLGVAR